MGRLLRRFVDVRDDEVSAMLVSFAFFFCVLSAWFVMRPIRDAVAAAQGAVTAARGGLAQAQSGIAGIDIDHNPDVLAAEAQLRAAALTLAHLRIVAPVDGIIAQRTVQVGQRVNAGVSLMSVVPASLVD